jgi:CubicO group peptidase (beta-lactamase class C family)
VVKVDESLIHGTVEPGFEPVSEEFIRNFRERGEIGAACAIYHKDKKIVDLWGGYRDYRTKEPWEEDTMVNVFSTTKGVSALTVAHAHSRGLIDYDEKVAAYWPEFAQNGKESVTVRQLLSHQAGLSTMDDLNLETLSDFDTAKVADALVHKKPEWEPGTRQGYHCWTLGWYASELLRHADPKKRPLGKYFAEEIARPLGLEFYIGLPRDIPDSQIANIKGINSPIRLLFGLGKMPKGMIGQMMKKKSLTRRSVVDPKTLLAHKNFNTRELRSVEMPSGNGIGQPRSLAKLYSEFATGGRALGIKKVTLDEISAPLDSSLDTFDTVARYDIVFRLGFMRPIPSFTFGTSGRSFGHAGSGGSLAFADPDARVGYAYAPNKVDLYVSDDPREKSLRDAFYKCLR